MQRLAMDFPLLASAWRAGNGKSRTERMAGRLSAPYCNHLRRLLLALVYSKKFSLTPLSVPDASLDYDADAVPHWDFPNLRT